MKSASVALFVLLALLPATGWAADGDPTATLVPSVACTESTCEQAASALASGDYEEAAQLYENYFEELADDDGAAAWLVHAAYASELAEKWDRAAALYAQAAEQIEPLQRYLLVQATRATLAGSEDQTIIDRAFEHDAFAAGYADGYWLAARAQTRSESLPDVDTTAAALRANDRDKVCPWLLERLAAQESEQSPPQSLYDLAHGHCVDEDYDAILADLAYEPSPQARLKRADHLAWAVRFSEALAEIDALDRDRLTSVEKCRADFRRARSHFRQRRYSVAEEIYRQIVADCTDDDAEDYRVRSLYAAGNRNYQRDRLDEARHFFSTLYEEFPDRSHADDALFFLARIERATDNSDREREKSLLNTALQDYPDGDMIHEMVWEVYEDTFRSGNYEEFIEEITALPLPDWDAQYFSQGRLEYFVGLAHQRLGDIDEAVRYWQLAWVKYPFSFYGYIGHLRLLENDHQPEPLHQTPRGDDAHWFAENFDGTGADILAQAGHLAGACDFESGRLSVGEPRRGDHWRLATLCHRAGEYTLSHNVARRQISGRPWAAPQRGRLARWHVAWPNPFGPQLAAAVERLGPDDPELYVHPGFAASIMREESGFEEDVVSWAGALGLMQLMPATARDHDDAIDGIASPDRLVRAEINIPVGVDHLIRLARRFDGHPVLMTAAYNAGGGAVDGWLRRQPNDEIALFVEDIPYLQTRNYSKRVLGSYAAYQLLSGDEVLDARLLRPAR